MGASTVAGPRDDNPKDRNLENLIDNWDDYKDNLIIFLGAGASMRARGGLSGDEPLPGAFGLRNDLWQKLYLRADERDKFEPEQLGMMTLEHAAALIETRKGRQPLVDHIARLCRTQRPRWAHVALPLLQPRAVFTTNYDRLIEQGWEVAFAQRHVQQPLNPVFAAGQRPSHGAIPLFKPHGCVNYANDVPGRGGLVITMFDYFTMLTTERSLLEEWLVQFRAKCAIFIGYSFMDADIASYLFDLRKKESGLHWYAVFPRADEEVREMYARRFGIRQIDRTFDDFLAELDARVDFLPAGLKVSQIPELQKLSIQ